MICKRSTTKKMAELRENARYIFWSGALAFHGPKIIFLHDKHEELLVEKSLFHFMYICIPPMLWSSEIWQNSAYKRNRKYSVLYAGGYKRKKVQLEMKYNYQATPTDEKQLMKK